MFLCIHLFCMFVSIYISIPVSPVYVFNSFDNTGNRLQVQFVNVSLFYKYVFEVLGMAYTNVLLHRHNNSAYHPKTTTITLFK